MHTKNTAIHRLGVTHFMLFFGDFPKMDGLRTFAEKVIKKHNSEDLFF